VTVKWAVPLEAIQKWDRDLPARGSEQLMEKNMTAQGADKHYDEGRIYGKSIDKRGQRGGGAVAKLSRPHRGPLIKLLRN